MRAKEKYSKLLRRESLKKGTMTLAPPKTVLVYRNVNIWSRIRMQFNKYNCI